MKQTKELLLNIPEGYKFKEIRDNKVILEKTREKLPESIQECCDFLGTTLDQNISGYKHEFLEITQKLYVVRDALWKWADNWKPEFNDANIKKYVIYKQNNKLKKDYCYQSEFIFAFPTEELRDHFYNIVENELKIFYGII